jgi:hypothetical protein
MILKRNNFTRRERKVVASHVMKNISFAALLRAVRVSSHSENLAEEIEKIRITLLINKYPTNFIDRHFQRFYETLTGQKNAKLLSSEKNSEFRN